jgi:zinc protease
MAGDFSDEFLMKVKKDLGNNLPAGQMNLPGLPEPFSFNGLHARIIQKETRATAVSFGFPIDINRSHEDFAALWLVRSYLGEHRSQNGLLYNRIREIRGMNYGDYAYIEYFPRGMFQFHPDPNLGRRQQIFQIWIRPVETNENAHFATRVAMYELNKLIEKGISKEDFEITRNYLLKFVNILTKTQDRQLGYAMDSEYYDIGEFTGTIAAALKKLNADDVNRVIDKYLQSDNIKFVFITNDAEDMKQRLAGNAISEIVYSAEKPAELLQEDKIIEKYDLKFKPENIDIIPVESVFVD